MSGSLEVSDCTLEELIKLPIKGNETSNFESITLEKLKALTDKPKLQKFKTDDGPWYGIELFFSNGLENVKYSTVHRSSLMNKEHTWDNSKQIKKVATRLHGNGFVSGIKFLDEKDNEIYKWEYSTGTYQPTKEIPDGFEIIGLYGDTTKADANAAQFGFLLWKPKP